MEKQSTEDKIQEINKLIQEGEAAAKAAEGKFLLLVLGNTGAGKSTAINYIDGDDILNLKSMIDSIIKNLSLILDGYVYIIFYSILKSE